MAFILLFAGFETTVNLIGNGMYALLHNPGQRERLQRSLDAGETGLLETGIEELLRYDGPVELATWRFATEPLSSAGSGSRRATPYWWSSPPRTGTRNGSPTPTRSTSPGVTISTSATVTASTTAWARRSPGWRDRPRSPRLLRRLPDLHLAVEPADLRWRGGLIMRGLRTLPVEFRPGHRSGEGDALSTP